MTGANYWHHRSQNSAVRLRGSGRTSFSADSMFSHIGYPHAWPVCGGWPRFYLMKVEGEDSVFLESPASDLPTVAVGYNELLTGKSFIHNEKCNAMSAPPSTPKSPSRQQTPLFYSI